MRDPILSQSSLQQERALNSIKLLPLATFSATMIAPPLWSRYWKYRLQHDTDEDSEFYR